MKLLLQCATFCLGVVTLAADADDAAQPMDTWQQAVRSSPYWVSQGVFNNLTTIRRWVLTGESYCEQPNRHILFDRQARFLTYMIDGPDAASTQERLNRVRAQLVANGKVEHWSAGARGRAGYPFALSCNQPDARLDAALARYLGEDADARLWGTWDGMRVGTREATVSLHQALAKVYRSRVELGRVSMPDDVLSTLAGKILIESGGRPAARSAAGARGILQLTPVALKDCKLHPRHHLHRLAQIDCALRLLEQNHQNLQAPFARMFGHLPQEKREALYAMLLIQAYHGGVGRVTRLLADADQMAAARYFAQHHPRFSAGDIALGMIFHNLGRDRWGFASLYYVTDVGIAVQEACAAAVHLPGCAALANEPMAAP